MADGGFSEDIVEHAGIEILKDLGWLHLHGASIAPDGPRHSANPSPNRC